MTQLNGIHRLDQMRLWRQSQRSGSCIEELRICFKIFTSAQERSVTSEKTCLRPWSRVKLRYQS